jgi:hypothetical protein
LIEPESRSEVVYDRSVGGEKRRREERGGRGRTMITAETPIGERWRSLAKKIGKNLIVIPEASPEMISAKAIMEGT